MAPKTRCRNLGSKSVPRSADSSNKRWLLNCSGHINLLLCITVILHTSLALFHRISISRIQDINELCEKISRFFSFWRDRRLEIIIKICQIKKSLESCVTLQNTMSRAVSRILEEVVLVSLVVKCTSYSKLKEFFSQGLYQLNM